MGAGPGNPSLPHPQTPDSGAKTGSYSDCQVDRYLYLHLQELGQRHSPDAICCWVRRGDCRLVGGGRCSVTCYTHVLDAT